MKKAWVVLLVLLFASPCMANVFTWGAGGKILTISTINADWNWYDSFPDDRVDGIKTFSIRFNPGAASDRCVINDGGIDGAALFDSGVAAGTGDVAIQYYPIDKLKPVIDVSDGTYNAGATLTIMIIR